MNNFFKIIVQFFLKRFAKIYLRRAKPAVIVIAGTTGRHWAKEAITEILEENFFSARANKKNFNAEIGLPLSILDLPSGEGDFRKWLGVLRQAAEKAFSTKRELQFPDYLVLEMAIDSPDDMDYLLSIVKPQIAVFTTITMIYPENFEDLDEIFLEYKKLIKNLPRNGLAILNADDERIVKLKESARCRTITYGIKDNEADYSAKNIRKLTDGQSFTISVSGRLNQGQQPIVFSGQKPLKRKESAPLKISRFGNHHIYSKIIQKAIADQLIATSQ